MAYSKKKTARKATVQALSVFLAALAIKYIPDLGGLEQSVLIGLISGGIVSLMNYLKHK